MTRAGATLFVIAGLTAAAFVTRHVTKGPKEELKIRESMDPELPPDSPSGRRPGAPSLSAMPAPGDVSLIVLASETKRPVVGARWRIARSDGTTIFEGTTGPEGESRLSHEMLGAWEDHGLQAWGEDRRYASFRSRPPVREGAIEILLDRFHVDFQGAVVDEAGSPVPEAQVAIVYWSNLSSSSEPAQDDVFRTTADASGRFRRSAKVWYPKDEGIDGHTLWVGGPGWVPVSLQPNKRGQRDLVVRLTRDREHGTLDVQAVGPDGKPARGASVWVGAHPGVADERISPEGHARRVFAEVWRDADDPRRPGSKTWTYVGHERRPAWHHVLGEGGRRLVHPVPVGRVRVQARGPGSADVWVDVLPPPAVTPVVLRLEPLRTVRGTVRVAEGSGWSCRHPTHEHRVAVEDWPETPAPATLPAAGSAPSSPEDREARGSFPTGAFSIEGLPRSAATLRLSTPGHPDVLVSLPSAGDDAPVDVGVVEVPAARVISGLLEWPEGRRPEPWSTLRLEDDDGLVADASTYWTTDGGPRFDFVAPRRPGAGARIVVRLRPSEGDGSKVVRLDGPFDLDADPLRLRLPPDTEGRKDGP